MDKHLVHLRRTVAFLYILMRMHEELTHKLNTLRKFFDVDEVLRTKIDQEYITAYYRVNKLAYSFLHTKQCLVHMGITAEGGTYSDDDLYAQVNEIHKLIAKSDASHVLELATGRGGNSAWLASRNPTVSFVGMDISPTQLIFAKRIAHGIENFEVVQGSFNDLSQFADASFDLVFIIEALCYSFDLEDTLSQISRVLRKGGSFLVYDGYRARDSSTLHETEAKLMRLLEVGVAVERFTEFKVFLNAARKAGLEVDTTADLSTLILPTVRRFERQAKAFFRLGGVAKALLMILPKKFSYNIISGYLFPALLEEKLFCYSFTILRKN